LNEIKNISKKHPMALLPRPEVKLYVDSNYIFAACGLISQIDPESAKKLLMEDVKSVG